MKKKMKAKKKKKAKTYKKRKKLLNNVNRRRKKEEKKELLNIMNSGVVSVRVLSLVSLKTQQTDKNSLNLPDGIPLEIKLNSLHSINILIDRRLDKIVFTILLVRIRLN